MTECKSLLASLVAVTFPVWLTGCSTVSILIGVNDLNFGVSAEQYEQQYDQLLADTVKTLPNVKLVLCEPFGLPVGAKKAIWEKYRADLAVRQAIVAKLGEKHHAPVVHFQKMFDDAVQRAPAISGNSIPRADRDPITTAMPPSATVCAGRSARSFSRSHMPDTTRSSATVTATAGPHFSATTHVRRSANARRPCALSSSPMAGLRPPKSSRTSCLNND